MRESERERQARTRQPSRLLEECQRWPVLVTIGMQDQVGLLLVELKFGNLGTQDQGHRNQVFRYSALLNGAVQASGAGEVCPTES